LRCSEESGCFLALRTSETGTDSDVQNVLIDLRVLHSTRVEVDDTINILSLSAFDHGFAEALFPYVMETKPARVCNSKGRNESQAAEDREAIFTKKYLEDPI